MHFGKATQWRFRVASCVGYALLLHVCQMTLWGGLLLASRMSLDVLGLIAWWSVPLCVALSIACLGIAGVSLRRLKGLSGRAAAAIAAVSGAAVLSGYFVAVYAGDASVFVCAGAVLVGLGMALAFSSWCSVFGSMGSCRATDIVLLAVVLGSSFSLATSFSRCAESKRRSSFRLWLRVFCSLSVAAASGVAKKGSRSTTCSLRFRAFRF